MAAYQDGYKVVREIDDKFVSSSDRGRVVEYRLNKYTKRPANCGPFVVFSPFAIAKHFAEFMAEMWWEYPFIVFKCRFLPSEQSELRYTLDGLPNSSNWV